MRLLRPARLRLPLTSLIRRFRLVRFQTNPWVTSTSLPLAVASSGLPVTFSSSDSLIAQIQGTAPNQTIKIRAAGTATITASQIGNGAYNTAPSVTQTVTVGYFNSTARFLTRVKTLA